jgi:hypothetical protein
MSFVSSKRVDAAIAYIPYITAGLLVMLYLIVVVPRIQDYAAAVSSYAHAVERAAHAQEFPRGCNPVTRYNRPVFETYGLY